MVRPERPRGGHANRGSHTCANRAVARGVLEHTGDAYRCVRRSELQRAVASNAADDVGGVCAPGRAVREAGTGAAAAACVVASALVPGDAGAAEPAAGAV